MLLRLRQPFQLAQHCRHSLRLVHGLVGRDLSPNKALREPNIELIRPHPPPPIQRQIPCNPHQPDTHLANLIQLVPALHHADKHILHHILSFGPIAQYGMCNAKEQPGVRLDESREINLFPRSLYPRKRQK